MQITGPVKIGEVFKTVGQPTITYVERDHGKIELRLKNALDTSGQLCLITGPSKTGKTTLYKKVISDLRKDTLIVRCDNSLTSIEFWAKALEAINFSRLKELHEESKIDSTFMAKIGGKLGWSWLAEAAGEVGIEITTGTSEAQIRERILANPSPTHLIPVLKRLPLVLVIEDFHYLKKDVAETIFQQWKAFVDEEVSVIIVGTTHHAVDIVSANKDLLARKCHIDLDKWQSEDLQRIVEKGFKYLGVNISSTQIDRIAKESVGLPIITQQVCETMFIEQGILIFNDILTVDTSDQIIAKSLSRVAKEKYGELEQYYNRLVTGPRKRARKFDTYEMVLSCFSMEPIQFELSRHLIKQRLSSIKNFNGKIPPDPSINAMLRALDKFQKDRGFELLEWHEQDRILYMLEPSFMFYLRWRNKDDNDNVNSLLKHFRVSTFESVLENFFLEFKSIDRIMPANKNLKLED